MNTTEEPALRRGKGFQAGSIAALHAAIADWLTDVAVTGWTLTFIQMHTVDDRHHWAVVELEHRR